jgi:drug/metabolite transporter (DMT)-like permease
MGFDWPASPLFFGVISLVLIGVLWVHARNLLKSAPVKIATRLVLLRIFSLALLLALLARPFLEQEELRSKQISFINPG